ncbi:Cyanovirin-N [Mycena venus]|uniref:Cyanovirin-N n=1 Tax=Mycena venus TaxID=2733690 RepID=A0A8H6XQP3_9AGAR|nr:Cyanovirin-N [Mycena venus]
MNSLLSAVVLVLCVLAAAPGAIAFPVAPPEPENFSDACSNISVDLSELVLTATCVNIGGVGSTTSSIFLNACIANTNGVLTLGSDFSDLCAEFGLSGLEFSALCTTSTGGWISSEIDLDDVLSTENGLLICQT